MDQDKLIQVEHVLVTKHIKQLRENPITISSSEDLFMIHKTLFQEIYDWAGQRRRINTHMGTTAFINLGNLDTEVKNVDALVQQFKQTKNPPNDALSNMLAVMLDNINFIHPFKHGNGRTQRLFITLLAHEKNVKLNLNPPDDPQKYDMYMSASVHRDVPLFAKVIANSIES
jgi:cell filamentation protein